MPSIEVTIPKDLSPDEYRKRVCMAAIAARYGTVAKFAEIIGVRRQSVYYTLAGVTRSGRIAGALSALTGVALHTLFPPEEKAA
jgi:hypothetical protein